VVFAAVLFASLPAPIYASPDVPMCVADQRLDEAPPISLVQWRAPMCGPFVNAFPAADMRPTKARAIEAYREALALDSENQAAQRALRELGAD